MDNITIPPARIKQLLINSSHSWITYISSMKYKNKTILHMDMDCFYAAIETRDNPKLTGKPVIVGAKPGCRGVVSACNYEARKYGIHSAMPISRAFKLCPQGHFLKVDMEKYENESDKIMAILKRFTDKIEPISVDEAYLDISDLNRLFGTPQEIGQEIKALIKKTVNLTASVGIAPNKFIAKIASDIKKPDGFLIVKTDETQHFLDSLPISRLPGIGGKTGEILRNMGIQTILNLRKTPKKQLETKFGNTTSAYIWDLANGKGDDCVVSEHEAKSVSREITFQEDTVDRQLLRRTLLLLTDDVASRLRRYGLKGRTIALNFRTPDFARHSRHKTLENPTNQSNLLFKTIMNLFEREISYGSRIRLIGMGVSNFNEKNEEAQLNLFSREDCSDPRQERLDAVRDKIQARFGDQALSRASLLIKDSTALI